MERKIGDIKTILEQCDISTLDKVLDEFRTDERKGVIKLVDKYNKILGKLEVEKQRIENMREYEEKYSGLDFIGGIDEVGRGPLAGPVVTCAVVLPKGERILYVNDSKQLSEKRREELYEIIMDRAIAVGIGIESPNTIDDINILQATFKAMRQSINNLSLKPDIMLNDAVTIPGITIPQVPIIKGDTKSITIACASIVAKVTRDRMMVEYDKLYPQYDFAANKGYGSSKHIEAIREYGPCPIHRRSFIKNFL
ncbi:MAG: ribonuclease HII [Clostridiales bacterium]|nr:ribonuclease HII [Clostridiales bacterium]